MTTRPADVVCTQWEPAKPGSKACRYYLKPGTTHDSVSLEKRGPAPSGLCALPSEMLCVEWVRRNGSEAQQHALGVPPLRTTSEPEGPAPAPKKAYFRTPFGQATVDLPEPFKPAKEIDPERLAALEQAGVEVTLSAPYLGERGLTLVPTRTGREDRSEITYREAAVIRLIVDAFPGAHVTAYTAAPPGGATRAAQEAAFETYPLAGTLCSECREPQRVTPGGSSCSNGHGGAPALDNQTPEEDPLS